MSQANQDSPGPPPSTSARSGAARLPTSGTGSAPYHGIHSEASSTSGATKRAHGAHRATAPAMARPAPGPSVNSTSSGPGGSISRNDDERDGEHAEHGRERGRRKAITGVSQRDRRQHDVGDREHAPGRDAAAQRDRSVSSTPRVMMNTLRSKCSYHGRKSEPSSAAPPRTARALIHIGFRAPGGEQGTGPRDDGARERDPGPRRDVRDRVRRREHARRDEHDREPADGGRGPIRT